MSVDYRPRTRGAFRFASGVFVLAAVASWLVGCGDPQPPVAVGSMPELTVEVGSTESVDLAAYFRDPDGDVLMYVATTSDSGVATASVSESAVTVNGVSEGIDTVTVTATDPSGLTATQAFTVTVRFRERQVLEILYDELGGDDWIDNTNWKTDEPLDEWFGVSTSGDGRVDALVLWGNSLTGEIPPELGGLSNLDILWLWDNSLTGEIPPELGNLASLEWLDLNLNSLTGEIPSELGDLSKLEFLYLAHNSLTGPIPRELGGLSNLEILDLWGNSLTGEIPPELGDLSNLGSMYLGSNSLTGEIPPDFLDLSLHLFHWGDNDGLCAPNTVEFDDWLGGLLEWSGPRCD